MNRIDLIAQEIETNEQTTKQYREKIKTIRNELEVFMATGQDNAENIEVKKDLVKKLSSLDQEYNKLRSDWYFLMSEKKQQEKGVS
jgi:predicted aminopeptidase